MKGIKDLLFQGFGVAVGKSFPRFGKSFAYLVLHCCKHAANLFLTMILLPPKPQVLAC